MSQFWRRVHLEAVQALAQALDVPPEMLDDSAFRRRMKRRERFHNRRNTSTSARFRAGTRALKR